MQKRNRIVSAVLSIGLMAGFGCAPEQTEPTAEPAQGPAQTEAAPLAAAEPVNAKPALARDTQTAQSGQEAAAMASPPYTIVWDDFSRVSTFYQTVCTVETSYTCKWCHTYNYSAYMDSACTDPNDEIGNDCRICHQTQQVPYTSRVLLPDGDLIDVTIEHNATAWDGIEFRLESASNVTWWKQVALTGTTDYWAVWNQDGQSWCNWPQAQTAGCNTNSQWASVALNPSSYFIFSKAKWFGIHEDMYVLHNLADRLTGGDRVTFRWVQD